MIVVPHAGYGQNAYYDRSSKSLQFYYFDDGDNTVYTCLSSDIVCHEFAHAVLDGVRPFFNEAATIETAAFHEFVGDLSAILLTLQNKELRKQFAIATGGKIEKAETLTSIAEQFGKAVLGRPYLRSAINNYKMSGMAKETDPHAVSEVLTGAIFDILKTVAKQYQEDPPATQPQPGEEAPNDHSKRKKLTPLQAFWNAADRMRRMAIQPLDLLPPVDVTFRDYAVAVCRSQQWAEPLDPRGYHGMLIDVFEKREILSEAEAERLRQPDYITDRLRLSVRHNINSISRSRAAAYRFLDDNRKELLIPASQDFFVSDLYESEKRGRQNVALPRQIVLEYVWREEVPLIGPQFEAFDGRSTTMLCGGTLVFNSDGILLSWAMKPGSQPYDGKQAPTGLALKAWDQAVIDGTVRRDALLASLAAQIAAGRIGTVIGSEKGLLGSHMPPMTAEEDGDSVRFQLSPHLHLSETDQIEDQQELSGGRRWEVIS